MNEKSEPSDEALAVFSQSHPGHEREALKMALRWYEIAKGESCTRPADYFGAWTTQDLATRFKLAAPPRPVCDDCQGDGWITDPDNNNEIVGRCACRKRDAA